MTDAISLIRARPDMFFETGAPTTASLLAAVRRDAGAAPLTVVHDGDWTLATSPIDWLAGQGVAVPDLFERFVVPSPSRGPNEHRAEVLLAAVCAGVGTWGPPGEAWLRIERADVPPSLQAASLPGGRTLVWRFADACPQPSG